MQSVELLYCKSRSPVQYILVLTCLRLWRLKIFWRPKLSAVVEIDLSCEGEMQNLPLEKKKNEKKKKERKIGTFVYMDNPAVTCFT